MSYQRAPYKQRYQRFGQQNVPNKPQTSDPKKLFHNLEYLNKNVQEFKVNFFNVATRSGKQAKHFRRAALP